MLPVQAGGATIFVEQIGEGPSIDIDAEQRARRLLTGQAGPREAKIDPTSGRGAVW